MTEYIAYRFDENTGTTSEDFGTAGIDLVSIPGWAAGHTGYAMSASDTDGGTFTLPSSISGDWTFMAWVKYRTNGDWTSILEKGGDYPLEILDGYMDVYFATGSLYIDGGAFPEDTWTHCAVVNDTTAGTLRLVIGGTTNNSVSGNASLSSGTWELGGSWGQPMDGEVDDFRIFTSALADAEIAAAIGFTFEEGVAGEYLVVGDNAGYVAASANSFTYRADNLDGGLAIEYTGTPSASIETNFTASGILYVSMYVKIQQTSSFNTFLARTSGAANETISQIRFETTRAIKLYDKDINAGISSTTLIVGEWYRLDWTLNRTAGTQELKIFTGSNLHGSTPTETLAGGAGTLDNSTATTMDQLDMGPYTNVVSNASLIRLDRVSYNTATMPAPYSPPAASFIGWGIPI